MINTGNDLNLPHVVSDGSGDHSAVSPFSAAMHIIVSFPLRLNFESQLIVTLSLSKKDSASSLRLPLCGVAKALHSGGTEFIKKIHKSVL